MRRLVTSTTALLADDRAGRRRAVAGRLLAALAVLVALAGGASAAPETGEEPGAGAPVAIGAGTYEVVGSVFGTGEDGLIGAATASGHVVQPDDRLVALPACTVSSCPWLPPGTGPEAEWGPQTSCAEGDGLCWVEVSSLETGACAVAPVLDLGPLFVKDNWWAPREARTYDLEEGLPAAEAAAGGADLGFGPGLSDRGYDIANVYDYAAAIDIAAGTWTDLGLDVAQGVGRFRVRLLWQAELFHDQACGGETTDGGQVTGAENATTTDDLNLRAAPGLDAEILSVIPAGRRVAVTGPAEAGFYPTTHGGRTGWTAGDFLAFDAGDPGALAFAVDDLNLRAGPSLADEVLRVLPAGSLLAYTGEAANGFVAVAHGDARGWVYAAYLDAGGGAGPGPDTAVTTDDLNVRAGPSTADAVLAVLPPGASVVLTGGEANGFLAVRHGEFQGWAAASYLAPDAAAVATAVTTDALNLRAGPSLDDAVLMELPAGTTVTLTGDRVDGFAVVSHDGATGWVATAYLD